MCVVLVMMGDEDVDDLVFVLFVDVNNLGIFFSIWLEFVVDILEIVFECWIVVVSDFFSISVFEEVVVVGIVM